MIDVEKSQNEKFANDLNYFRDLTHENSGILKDLQEENEKLKSKAATLEEKCQYIELLENQKI